MHPTLHLHHVCHLAKPLLLKVEAHVVPGPISPSICGRESSPFQHFQGGHLRAEMCACMLLSHTSVHPSWQRLVWLSLPRWALLPEYRLLHLQWWCWRQICPPCLPAAHYIPAVCAAKGAIQSWKEQAEGHHPVCSNWPNHTRAT